MQDLRLGIPALIVWVVAAIASSYGLAVAGVGILALVCSLGALRTWDGEPLWARALAVIGASLLAGGVAAFGYSALEDADPVTDAAAAGAWVRIDGTVVDRPAAASAFGAPIMRAEVEVNRVERFGETRTANTTVRVSGPAEAFGRAGATSAGGLMGSEATAAGGEGIPAGSAATAAGSEGTPEGSEGTPAGGEAVATGSRVVFRAKLSPAEDYDSAAAYANITKFDTHRPAGGAQAVANYLHRELMTYTADMPDHAAGLVPGVVVGDDSRLSDADQETMRIIGLSHLTAVSGAHVSLVLGGIASLVGRRHRFASGAISLVGLFALVTLVGSEPSVLRAGYMGLFICVAIALRRPTSAFPLLAVTVIGVALADPHLATSLGFRLSAVATAAIVVFGYRMREVLTFLPGWLAELIAIPLVASLATMQFVMTIQETSSVWTVVANILVAPVVAPLTISGLLGTLSLGIESALQFESLFGFGGLSGPLLGFASACTWWIYKVAMELITWPGSGIAPIAAMAANLLVLGLLIGAHFVYSREILTATATRVAVAGVLIILGIAGYLLGQTGGPRTRSDWEIIQCDVGQGSATLLRRGSSVALIDVGHENEGIARCMEAAGVEKIDLLVLTHFDSDHVRGLAELLDVADVEAAWVSENDFPHRNSQWVSELLTAHGVEVSSVSMGASFEGWIDVVSPSFTQGLENSTNDDSLVVSAQTDSHHALVLADTGEEAQERLLASAALADVIARKGPASVAGISHHGSANQSERLAQHLDPLVSLVAVGENSYGHPTETALRAWDAPIVRRTDLCGQIVVSADMVETEMRCDE